MTSYGACGSTSSSIAQDSNGSSADATKKTFPFIDFRELQFVKKIAKGGMAEISLYKWTKPEFPSLVAIKSLFRTFKNTSERNYLETEMSILNDICHPNIVMMFGVVETDRDFGLVMEYFDFGSYRKFFGGIRSSTESSSALEKIMIPLKIRILDEVINGMAYLHGIRPRIVLHLDLKSDNVLLDRGLHAKICDFGLSRMSTLTSLRNRTTMKSAGLGGTPGYISPERLRDISKKPTSKSDVYSFSILMWEISTDRTPYEDVEVGNDYALLSHHILCNDLRPNKDLIPNVFPQELVTVMTRCWQNKPEDRPTFAELHGTMESIKKRIPEFEAQASTSTKEVLCRWRSIPLSTSSNSGIVSRQLSERARTRPAGISFKPGPKESVTTPGAYTIKRQISTSMPSMRDSGTTSIKQLADGNNVGDRETTPWQNFQLNSDRDPQIQNDDSTNNRTDAMKQLVCRDDEQDGRINSPFNSEEEPLIPKYGVIETRFFSPTKIILLVTVLLAFGAVAAVIWWSVAGQYQADQKCPNVKTPDHGNMSCSDEADVVNKKCTFSCDSGYEIVGVPTIVCTAGKWNAEPPICKSACNSLASVDHGNFSCTNKNFVNSTCNFTCKDNHKIQGDAVLTCQQNRRWSNPEPSCVCPVCTVGNTCQHSIRWKDVSDQLDAMVPYGTIIVDFGGHTMICTTHMHGFVKWSGLCQDKDSGASQKCVNYDSANGAAKHAASQLIRNLVGQKKYPEPCDPKAMETGC